jgi:hypothetical protein
MTATPATAPPMSKSQPATPVADPSHVPTMPAVRSEPKTKPLSQEQSYWGDWVAMVFWFSCFVLMGLIHLSDLIMSFFR